MELLQLHLCISYLSIHLFDKPAPKYLLLKVSQTLSVFPVSSVAFGSTIKVSTGEVNFLVENNAMLQEVTSYGGKSADRTKPYFDVTFLYF